MSADVAAVILAAGRASRWRASGGEGPTKLLAAYRGASMVANVVAAAAGSRARPIIVVLGHEAEAVRGALDGFDARFVVNAEFEDGLATSLRAGLLATPTESAGAVILLGDMPEVSAALIDRLIERFAAGKSLDAVIPVIDGERGNPVLLARSLFSQAQGLAGDQGARRLLTKPGVIVAEIEAGPEARLDLDDAQSWEDATRRRREF
jgi:molybdenum cofactor cytidylyltransferase